MICFRIPRGRHIADLPWQYHFPSERQDPDSEIVRELKELGAELVEAKGQEKDAGKNKSYHLKAIAVVQCPWREVLYLVSFRFPQLRLMIRAETSLTLMTGFRFNPHKRSRVHVRFPKLSTTRNLGYARLLEDIGQ